MDSDVELDALASHWQWALDAAASALDADRDELSPVRLVAERQSLSRERDTTSALLARIADLHGVRARPWLAPVPVTPRLLGLPSATKACLFDLDGVLTDSAALHAHAWAEALDAFLLGVSQSGSHDTGWQFVPFDRNLEYRAYFDGRPRLEGLHLFLAARGLHVDEETANAIARRKGDVLEHGLERHEVAALPGAHTFLQAAGHARLARAVVSASTTTLPMLQLARVDQVVEARVDAETMRAEGLRSRPAPDLLLAACRELGVAPESAVSLTHSDAGVAAARSAGMPVIGIASGETAERLLGFGADRVAPSLLSLLDPRLRASSGAWTRSRRAA
ncbi:MAG TPA: HAD family hydrolase [Gaiellaceae bacterium]|nr:HAD family hydrolase [Gaiellaceae bacterium]